MNVTKQVQIRIGPEFSKTPGSRYITNGKHSGEQFREEVLKSKYLEAIQAGVKLHVDLDGTAGYATSFLEEAFGGLAREYGSAKVAAVLEFTSNDEPYLIEEIQKYISEAR